MSTDPQQPTAKRIGTFLLAFVVFGLLAACGTSAQETATFPGSSWERVTNPDEAGWSAERLEAAWRIAEEIGSGAIVVVQNGRIVAEWGDVDKKYNVFSARKQLLSALLGMEFDEGDLDLDTTLADLGIDDSGGLTEAERRATVADLMTSRSGVYHDAAYEAREHRRNRPPRGSHAPGTFFHYNNWDFNALGTIYEQVSGETVFEGFQRRVAGPLGMEDFDVDADTRYSRTRGSRHPAYLFSLTAPDLARYGLLWLRRGVWNGDRLLSEAWVGASTRAYVHPALVDLQSFGYLWWVYPANPGMFGASGKGNQKVVVWPERDLVVVHLADTKWLGLFGTEVKDRDFWRLFFAIAGAEERVAESGEAH